MTPHRLRSLTGLAALAGGLALAAAPPLPREAWAKDGPPNPLPAVLESVTVGPAIEFRQVVLHPLLLPKPADKPTALPSPASSTPAGAFGLGDSASGTRRTLAAKNLGDKPVLVHPGDVIRTDGGDFIVRAHAHLAAGHAEDLKVVLASREPKDEKVRPEPSFLAPVPGPAFQWFLMTEPKERTVVEAVHDLADEADLDTPRRSPAELAAAPKIAARVKEYVQKLNALRPGPAAVRRDICGYAVLIDGDFAGIELFGDQGTFAALWPGRLQAIGVEAALQEVELAILDKDLPDPADPDRFVADVKAAMLSLYDVRIEATKAAGFGRFVRIVTGDDLGSAAIAEDGRAAHLLVVRDPAARKKVRDEDGDAPAPGPISRKARPTEFERRWLERRTGRPAEVPGSGGGKPPEGK